MRVANAKRTLASSLLLQDSNVAGGDDINRNLKSFAARRTDIFGDQEVAIGEVVGKSAEQASSTHRVVIFGSRLRIAVCSHRIMLDCRVER